MKPIAAYVGKIGGLAGILPGEMGMVERDEYVVNQDGTRIEDRDGKPKIVRHTYRIVVGEPPKPVVKESEKKVEKVEKVEKPSK
jgi:hypothetical protein